MKYRTIIGAAAAILVPVLALGQATHSVGTANTTLGILKLFGSTSGDVSVKPAAVAGTSTVFQLPATNGSNGEFLQTNGSGVTSWQTATGSGTVNSGTAGQMAYYATSTAAVSGAASATISTGALSLGASGTVGSVTLGNGTSGTGIIHYPATGAMGTSDTTIPIGTSTMATLNLAETFSGAKTFGETHGTTYAPTLTSNDYAASTSDCGKTLLMPTGTTPTLTLPNLNASCTIVAVQNSATQFTVQAASGGSVVSVNSYTQSKAQNAILFLTIITPSSSAAKWALAGDGV